MYFCHPARTLVRTKSYKMTIKEASPSPSDVDDNGRDLIRKKKEHLEIK